MLSFEDMMMEKTNMLSPFMEHTQPVEPITNKYLRREYAIIDNRGTYFR